MKIKDEVKIEDLMHEIQILLLNNTELVIIMKFNHNFSKGVIVKIITLYQAFGPCNLICD